MHPSYLGMGARRILIVFLFLSTLPVYAPTDPELEAQQKRLVQLEMPTGEELRRMIEISIHGVGPISDQIFERLIKLAKGEPHANYLSPAHALLEISYAGRLNRDRAMRAFQEAARLGVKGVINIFESGHVGGRGATSDPNDADLTLNPKVVFDFVMKENVPVLDESIIKWAFRNGENSQAGRFSRDEIFQPLLSKIGSDTAFAKTMRDYLISQQGTLRISDLEVFDLVKAVETKLGGASQVRRVVFSVKVPLEDLPKVASLIRSHGLDERQVEGLRFHGYVHGHELNWELQAAEGIPWLVERARAFEPRAVVAIAGSAPISGCAFRRVKTGPAKTIEAQ